jgi:cytochrome c oxidase subunit 2
MIGDIVVQEPAQYEAWMSGGSTGPLSATGEKVFSELGCVTCHRADSTGRGPSLQGVFGKPVALEDGRSVMADENYIRECILDPGSKRVKGFQPIMPTFQGIVSEEQVNALVAYVKSLAQQGTAGAATKTAAVTEPLGASGAAR